MSEIAHLFSSFVHIVLHLDQYLASWSQQLGSMTYVMLFSIIFAETGLVIFPFLPGDSLLFAAGALTSIEESGINVLILASLLMLASFFGDNLNYFIGKKYGTKIFRQNKISILAKLFNQNSLTKTEKFFEKYGGRSIFLGRFVPIIRTFVPFVAGTAKMNYRQFFLLSAFGSICWINIFVWSGYYFGNLPSVKQNFHFVIIGVICISVLPIIIEFLKSKKTA